MTIAFCLFKYFPFGGLQRDFLRIAIACQQRGHAIRVYTLEWQGEVPAGFEVIVVPVRALSNHRRYEKFSRWVQAHLRTHPAQRLVGFNKMPSLDVYYAADACYEEKAQQQRGRAYRWSPRYRHFAAFERAVFAPGSQTKLLMIAERQIPVFRQHYGTPLERFHVLPPGIALDRRAPADAAAIRTGLRAEMAIAGSEFLLLQVGSGFKTKGLDRSLRALAALPDQLRLRAQLIAIGQDDAAPFQRLAGQLGLAGQVRILQGRSDVLRFFLGADLLLHPAYNENTGTVLLEAAVAGLPVVVSGACGYAHYIADAQAGVVVPEPFDQNVFAGVLAELLADPARRAEQARAGLRFAQAADIYGMPERAADLILA